MAELLLEIFSEEIPARMQVRAAEDFSKMMTDGLTEAGLTVTKAKSFSGPRRLVFVADVPNQGEPKTEERRGPKIGSADKAIQGFLRGLGDTNDKSLSLLKNMKPDLMLVTRLETGHEIRLHEDNKGVSYLATRKLAAPLLINILRTLVPNIVLNFPWPKSMKSGVSTSRWVRPIKSMICLIDGVVVDGFSQGFPDKHFSGVKVGDMTEGHRKHGKGPFKINNFESYVKLLEGEGRVVLSHDNRKELIINQARKACAEKGLELVEDEGLLSEVAGLAEWPVVILGDMDPSFLELPGEVIRLSMRTHQKYFAVRNPKTGELAPNFIVVANQDAPDGGKAIAAGNSRVLSARLADAKFFQSEDAKKSLADYYDKLDTVVFHKKLGTIKDKAERVAALARELAPKVGADPDKAEAAAKLAKNDLVTQMVIEFTSLEGQIGRLMYEREGGDPDIAVAIEDHYKPKGPSDEVPANPVAVAVALADKLYNLSSFWIINEMPTGSKDPFALRRSALGFVRTLIENNVRFSMGWAMTRSFSMAVKAAVEAGSAERYENLKSVRQEGLISSDIFVESLEELSESHNQQIEHWVSSRGIDQVKQVATSLLNFIADRLKVYLRDQGIRHDLIDAVFALGEDDLVAIVNRVKALQSFLDTKEGEDLLAGYKRAANILKAEAKKGDLPEGLPNRPDDKHGAALFDALQTASTEISSALEGENFEKAMLSLAELRAPIDAFFTEVQVISSDSAVKENNLRLLGLIRDTARQIADFEAING
ncbi:glycine--tRNA ligase subunit beta [Litorimonas sp.]|uniref:glycine--tRNA ligase subunit beta n=1 Tax=Litorimonas sp. TaxID=1892381 RepID=UPI003A85B55B